MSRDSVMKLMMDPISGPRKAAVPYTPEVGDGGGGGSYGDMELYADEKVKIRVPVNQLVSS